MKCLLIFMTSIFIQNISQAQIEMEPDRSLTGYWSGAMIRSGNSVQNMTAEIEEQGDSLVIGVSIPDWAYYPPRTSKLEIEKKVLLSFDTYYGQAEMVLDTNYMEMVGTIADANPPLQFHLKRNLKPFAPEIISKDIEIINEGANVSGTLFYRADLEEPMACAVYVHGRGCGTRYWKRSRAMKLAEYGIATFTYDKRGSEASGFPCEQSTHDLNVSDISAIIKKLSKEKEIDKSKIGLIATSAGGWTAPHATEVSEVPVAFLITMVGPTTSVLEQQVDGMRAFMEDTNMQEEYLNEAIEYTELMFEKNNQQKTYSDMMALLEKGKDHGWYEWLVEDDIPASPEAIKDLWVQRFSYDPAEALKSYEGPFLAIFSENDPVVPYKKQLVRLKELMDEAGKTNVTTKVMPSASHGMEHGSLVRDLGNHPEDGRPTYYFKYDRVSFGAVTYLIEFLEKYNFLQE